MDEQTSPEETPSEFPVTFEEYALTAPLSATVAGALILDLRRRQIEDERLRADWAAVVEEFMNRPITS